MGCKQIRLWDSPDLAQLFEYGQIQLPFAAVPSLLQFTLSFYIHCDRNIICSATDDVIFPSWYWPTAVLLSVNQKNKIVIKVFYNCKIHQTPTKVSIHEIFLGQETPNLIPLRLYVCDSILEHTNICLTWG